MILEVGYMASGKKRGNDKLYREWLSHGDIIPEKRTAMKKPDKQNPINETHYEIRNKDEHNESIQESNIDFQTGVKNKRSSNLLFILLAVSITLICAGLVLVLKIL